MLNKDLLDLYTRAGFSVTGEGAWPNIYSVGRPLEELVRIIVHECTLAADEHARSYSDVSTGAFGAANVIRGIGDKYLK